VAETYGAWATASCSERTVESWASRALDCTFLKRLSRIWILVPSPSEQQDVKLRITSLYCCIVKVERSPETKRLL